MALQFSQVISLALPHADIERRICKYLTDIGYQLTPEKEDRLIFTRGSMMGNFSSNNPRDWKTTVTAQIQPEWDNHNVLVSYHIRTAGQIVLSHERDYWMQEMETFFSFLQDGKYKLAELDASAQETTATGNMIVLAMTIVGIIMAFGFLHFVFGV